jgi:hypothetical protein
MSDISNNRTAYDVTIETLFLETEKLKLAKWILLGIAGLFLYGSITLLTDDEQGSVIFEACKTILPPIGTLIIGYYFTEKS